MDIGKIVIVSGVETDLDTNDANIKKYKVRLEQQSVGTCLILEGGPTGHESFVVTPEAAKNLVQNGWIANGGTAGQWKRLVIPASEMAKVFSKLGVL